MKLESEVAVVGGGIVGATLAAALAERGIRTALLERGSCAAQGASQHSGGIVRLYDPDPVVMSLAHHSLRCLRSCGFGREFARSLTHTGVLYRANAAQAEAVHAALATHADVRHPILVTEGSAASHGPWDRPREGRLDLLEPQGAVSDVRKAVRCMAGRMVRHGGLLLENVRVRGIATDGRDRAVLELDRGSLQCAVVVLAAGSWAAELLPNLGLQARSIPLVRLWASAPLRMPVIDAVAGSYAVPLAGNLVQVGSGIRDVAQRPEDLAPVGEAQYADALQRLGQLSGASEAGPVLDVLDGSDAYTTDGRPLVGFTGEDQPVYAATGLCGIGFKLAPGIADIAAKDIATRLGRDSRTARDDWSALRPARLHKSTSAAHAQEAR